jgi:RND family efflux transporter MFP subunit
LKLFCLLSGVVLLTSSGRERSVRAVEAHEAAVPVQVVPVTTSDWPSTYEATGTIRARTTATISAKVMGYVQQVNVQAGDSVRDGQVLITIDARDMETNVRRAEAAKAEVLSTIPEMDHGLAAAKANLDLAQTTFQRMNVLREKKSISNQEFDEATARLKAAQANYEMARARRTQIDSKLAQADQEVRAASIMKEYATIAAPFSGIVTARSVEPGNLAAPGAPLLTIEREGGYRLEAAVDESVKVGQNVDVTLDGIEGTVSARISEIVPSVDTASRSYTVKIDLPAMPQLRSGMFGRASFRHGSRAVLAIPARALIEHGQLQSLFVADGSVARTRLVTTARRGNDRLEVLSGLSAGESIIVPAPEGLRDGARIEVRK